MHVCEGLTERFRIGSVPYLNAVPLTHALGSGVTLLPPSRLADELHANRLDAALVSVTESLLFPGYRVVDGVGIVSHGEVASVILAHRPVLEAVDRVFVDPASRTSVELMRMLLAARGIHPRFEALGAYSDAVSRDAVLLIGNAAIAFRRSGPPHTLWDLGSAWKELTELPFVYAVWAVREDVAEPALADGLRAAAAAGIAALPELVAMRSEYDRAFRQAYLGGHIRYVLGHREKAGLAHFAVLLGRYGGRPAVPVRWF